MPSASLDEDLLVLLDVESPDDHDALTAVIDAVDRRYELPAETRAALTKACARRMGRDSAGSGLRIYDVVLTELSEPVAVVVRLAAGDLEDADRFLCFLISPTKGRHPHHGVAAELSGLMHDAEFVQMAVAAETPKALLDAYREAVLGRVTMSHLPVGMRRTGKLFGGVRADLARRMPMWGDDFKAGLSVKSLASILFMYFACIAAAVAFGGLLATLTGGEIGAIETVLASAVAGTLWALFAGQPLAIVGATGPNVVFIGILYVLCQRYDAPFLPTMAWTGLWSMLFMWILAATDASVLIRFFTRFTDEIFSALISLIFVSEALHDIARGFGDSDVQDDTALFTLVLSIGTFAVAFALSRLRRSPYLLPRVREFLSDFGPAIAIIGMTYVAFALHTVSLPRLPVPDDFAPTTDRSWFVNPLDAPRWVWFASAAPAALLTILIWFNQNVTARLIDSPQHGLKKGPAFHWDIAVMGSLVGLLSLFGLPWVVGAVVRSLNHVRSLRIDRPDGRVETLENRLTNLGVHVLMGGSLLVLPLLGEIPLAVLFGVFLFMGIGSLGGNQFVDRMRMWLMDPARYPNNHYMRAVPTRVVHGFTALQFVALVILWFVKSSAIGIAFPFFVALLIPIRMMLGRVLKREHIALLDADEVPADEEFREVGV